MRLVLYVISSSLAAAACGNEVPGASPDASIGDGGNAGDAAVPPDIKTIQPWAVGRVWTYRNTDPDNPSVVKVQTKTVEAYEDVGGAHAGTKAFRIRIEKLYGVTTALQDYVGDRAVRFAQTDYDTVGNLQQQQSFSPYRLKIEAAPDKLVDGATFSEMYDETTTDTAGTTTRARVMNWTVVSMNDEVTVPAGTFRCIHYHRVDPTTGKTKDYWYAPGIGKVKENGGGQIEELMSYTE